MFDLKTVADESVFTSARHTYTYTLDLPVTADVVWAGLVADRPLSWCSSLAGRYTSQRPFGVGTTRTVKVLRALELREKFFVWDEENYHHSFYAAQANVPLFSLFAEDYRLTPTSAGCTFNWTFAMEGRTGSSSVMALSQPVTKKILLDRLVSDTEKHFTRGDLA